MKSLNIPAIRLLEEVKPRRAIELAHAMGIERDLPPYLSLALGTGETTLEEITAAYGIFANQGIYQEPYLIERVENRYGHVLEVHAPKSREVIDERTAQIMVSMLRSVVDGGTGAPSRSKYQFRAPAGGKTGTTDDYSDAWFIGFIPRLSAGVWVGFDEKKSIGSRMTGAQAALPAWANFMKAAVGIYGEEDFATPTGLVRVRTCRETGLLASDSCPAVSDVFVPGTQPTRTCTIHVGGAGAPTEEAVDPEAH
jgi:penicillin-binding protein 1A